MKYGKLLIPLISLAATTVALADQKPDLFSGATKLSGHCTEAGHRENFFEFVLIQGPQGGIESKYGDVPGARVTVEYKSNGFPHHPIQYYHAKFLIHSFNGDLAVLEGSKTFEYLDHEQLLEATLQTKKGVKVSCVANVLNAN